MSATTTSCWNHATASRAFEFLATEIHRTGCLTFSLLLWDYRRRLRKGLADLSVCSWVGCWDTHTYADVSELTFTHAICHEHTGAYTYTSTTANTCWVQACMNAQSSLSCRVTDLHIAGLPHTPAEEDQLLWDSELQREREREVMRKAVYRSGCKSFYGGHRPNLCRHANLESVLPTLFRGKLLRHAQKVIICTFSELPWSFEYILRK